MSTPDRDLWDALPVGGSDRSLWDSLPGGRIKTEIPGLPHVAAPDLTRYTEPEKVPGLPKPVDVEHPAAPVPRFHPQPEPGLPERMVEGVKATGRVLASGHGEGVPLGAAARMGVEGVPEEQRSGNIEMRPGDVGKALNTAISLAAPEAAAGQTILGGMIRQGAGEEAPFAGAYEGGVAPEAFAEKHPAVALAANFVDPTALGGAARLGAKIARTAVKEAGEGAARTAAEAAAHARPGIAAPEIVASIVGGGAGAAGGAATGETTGERIRNAAIGGVAGLAGAGATMHALVKRAGGAGRVLQDATAILPAGEHAIEQAAEPGAWETAIREAEAAGGPPPGRAKPPTAPGTPGGAAGAPINPDEYVNISKLALDPTGEQRVRDMVARAVVSGQIPEKTVQPWTEARRTADRVAEGLGLDPKDIDVRLGKGRVSGPEMLAMESVIRTNVENVAKMEQRLTAEAATLTGEEAKRLQDTIDLANRQTDALLSRLSSSRTAAGRDLNNLKILANTTMDEVTWLRRAMERLGGPLTDEVRTKVRAFINQGDKLGLAQYVANLRKSTLTEKGVTLWKAGLLTSPTTHLANVLGNTSMAALETAKDAPAAVLDRLVSLGTGVRTKDFSLAGSIAASVRGAEQGAREAKAVMKGVPVGADNLKLDQLREVNYDNAFLNAYTKNVFRSLDAEDRIFRGMALQRSLAEQARVVAKAEGLAGDALAKRIADLTLNPSDEMALRAIEDSEIATFRNRGALGEAARGLKRPLGVVGEAVVPFTSTPANVAMRTLEYSPLGALASVPDAYRVFQAAMKGEALPAVQKRLVERLGRSATGTAPIALGLLLHRFGKMTASTPTDTGERGAWELEGKQANAVLIGGKWASVNRISPIGNLMALGAHLDEMLQKPDATAFSAAAGTAASMGKTLSEQSFLRGVQGALDMINDPERSAAKYVQSQAGSVVPAVVGRVAGGMDRTARKPTGPVEQVESRLPLLSRRVPARLNVFGEPVRREGGILGALLDPTNARSDATRTDPLIAEIARVGAEIPLPSKMKGEDPQAYTARQITEGQQLRETLAAVVALPQYQGIEDRARELVATSPAFKGQDPAAVARRMQREVIERVAREVRSADNQRIPGGRTLQRLLND